MQSLKHRFENAIMLFVIILGAAAVVSLSGCDGDEVSATGAQKSALSGCTQGGVLNTACYLSEGDKNR